MEPQTQQEIHGHLSKLVILIFILLIIGAVATWLGFRFIDNKSIKETNEAVTISTEQSQFKPLMIKSGEPVYAKKTSIINRAQKADSIPLLDDERKIILQELGPKTI